MPPAYEFKLALTRVIKLTGGPRGQLATLEDAVKLVGAMGAWRRIWRIILFGW